MKRKLLLVLLLFLTACSTRVQAHQLTKTKAKEKSKYQDDQETPPSPIAKEDYLAIYDFAKRSSEQLLSEYEEENLLYSPISLYLALSMLEPITFGDSLDRLHQVLCKKDLASLSQSLIEHISFYNELGIGRIANSLWLDKKESFNMKRLNQIASQFDAESFQVDFLNKNETEQQMSAWINEKTEKFIKELKLNLNPNTVLALVNTLYYKDGWLEPFVAENTKKDTFYQHNHVEKQVDFMKAKEYGASYYQDEETIQVSLPLRNRGDVLFIMNKNGQPNFPKIEEDKFQYRELNLSIPKFDLNNKLELNQLLVKLGLADLFQPSAQILPFEDDNQNAFISNVTQQARMAIDETGIEAAAYTMIELVRGARPQEAIEVKFNRPFMVILRAPNQLPLFVGWVSSIE